MRYLFIILFLLPACATQEIRTKESDKGLRIMIDPDSIEEKDYIKVTTAMVRSRHFIVVDRRNGYEAIKKEQERQHRFENDRFDNKEKWSHWGKFYGVGSIVVPYADCFTRVNRYDEVYSAKCTLSLAIIDANTAEIIVAVERKAIFNYPETPDWTDVVMALVEDYPIAFETFKENRRLEAYRKQSRELALIEQEKNEIPVKKPRPTGER